MSLTGWIIVLFAFALIIGAIITLKDSAKKLKLTEQQLSDIAKRNQEFDKEEAKYKDDKLD